MNIKDFKSGTLKQEMDTIIVSFGKKAHNASKLLEFLYQRPIVNMTDIGRELKLAKATVSSLVKDFEAKGILKETTGYERNKFYAFEKYLEAYSKN